jgi:hypothetical protein
VTFDIGTVLTAEAGINAFIEAATLGSALQDASSLALIGIADPHEALTP